MTSSPSAEPAAKSWEQLLRNFLEAWNASCTKGWRSWRERIGSVYGIAALFVVDILTVVFRYVLT
jgi:hypothetical protein